MTPTHCSSLGGIKYNKNGDALWSRQLWYHKRKLPEGQSSKAMVYLHPEPIPLVKAKTLQSYLPPQQLGAPSRLWLVFSSLPPYRQFSRLIGCITAISRTAAYLSQQRKQCTNPSQQRELEVGGVQRSGVALPKNFKKPGPVGWYHLISGWSALPHPIPGFLALSTLDLSYLEDHQKESCRSCMKSYLSWLCFYFRGHPSTELQEVQGINESLAEFTVAALSPHINAT